MQKLWFIFWKTIKCTKFDIKITYEEQSTYVKFTEIKKYIYTVLIQQFGLID